MHFCASLLLGLPMLVTAATQLGAEKVVRYGTPVRGRCGVVAGSLRGKCLATYLRVNHWADCGAARLVRKLSQRRRWPAPRCTCASHSAAGSRAKGFQKGSSEPPVGICMGLDLVQILVLSFLGSAKSLVGIYTVYNGFFNVYTVYIQFLCIHHYTYHYTI